ncbi:LLM class F420-dependent oxidoreductase [Nocardiopsis sp. CNR-923]|uniref:LLM class F420-dependent oxidoreductase n=1 Tax=Nocardiopsis sp. CNR-923 TaxID=1904965 RepID=UPI00095D569B|nr:LLM class F420-dependent oxidoreductase [Nocardiopsis sp. CNR-923]OLT30607.1 LLM class F420-dependent oxidoreductase [Nocardiopsis sp. CNR-923]
MELGLHVADFTWAGGAPELGRALARAVGDAEDSGIARVTVMDHFWQIGHDLGPYENAMLEAYTTLGFLAAHTSRVRLHTLVTGAVYHDPGVLAKQVTTLDVLSGGRAGLGIGAGWFADEARGLGLPFPSVARRFDMLEETLSVVLQMWSGDERPYEGEYYRLGRPLNSPAPLTRPHPYLMIGGSGERRTLPLVARHADACNIFGGPEAGRKLDVLKRHCEAVGRDHEEIEKTSVLSVTSGTTTDTLVRGLLDLRATGFTAVYVYGCGFDDPREAVDLIASTLPEVAEA